MADRQIFRIPMHLPTPAHTDTPNRQIEDLKFAFSAALSRAMNAQTYIDLSGESVPSPYLALAETLRGMLAEVEEIRTHAHDWNHNDYCSICGADGRS